MSSFTSDDYPDDDDRPQEHSSSNYNDKNTNGLVVALELSDDIELEEIVHKFEFDGRTSNLVLCLNHRYKKKIIISPITFKRWPQSIETFKSQVKSKGVNAKHIGQLCDIVNNNYEQISKAFLESIAASEEEAKEQEESIAQKVLRLAEEQCQELFVDQYNEPYAAVKIRGHLETLNLNYSRFKNWICKAYYQSEGSASVPNSESITNAINVLKANAEFDGKSKELHLRVAYGYGETKDEEFGMTRTTRTTIFYDLTNPDWEAVKVTPERWTIEKAPILFRRHNAQPQVYPSKEYLPDIFDRFMRLLNINGEETKILVKCYIIASFIPEFDKPILMLHGDPGAAKSTLQELIKTLVDPSSVLTFALPRDVNELVQQLDHNHIAFYDNVSKIPYWISDQFCRASTGAGSSKRRLFTDDDDKIYNFRRCVGFNGINLAATKSDLLDRGLIIRVERIDDKLKRKKGHIWQDFDEIKPQLLGYIFDIMVKVLSMRQTTSIKFGKLPRMADFAEIGEIISRCMGNPDNQFIDAYYENIKLQTEQILDASLVASAIVKLMSELNEWKGTATELLEQLDTVVGEKTAKNKYWPKTSSVLSRRVNEVKTNLREVNIIVEAGESDPTTRAKTMVITKVSDKSGELGKMPFKPLESFGDQNRAQNTSPSGMSGISGILRNSQEESHITNACDSIGREPSYEVTRYKLYWISEIGLWGCNNCKLKGDRFDMQRHDCRGKVKK